MTVSVKIRKGQKPTQAQCEEVRAASERIPVYDHESPCLSETQLKRYRQAALERKNIGHVTIALPETEIEKAKTLGGEDYRIALSKLLLIAMNEPVLLKSAFPAYL